ncbi:hypothetical protein WR25_23491 [Diploscapter pachys]|uniref:SCP domain-containing protein n=1 Tax=Diploscapter pachys TaxID=2018661 RepID=A0A2A2L948_9BILA|nr:hypothetical protein WR25_23491 [Diploscapter pachys]
MKLFLLLGLASTSYAATFGCSTTGITDTDRQMFYDKLNNGRRNVAKGQEPNQSGNLPAGKNIYEMNYDCNLEQVAYDWASQCSTSGLTGINSSYIALTSPVWSSSGAFDGNAKASTQLTTWWQTLQQNGIASDLTYSEEAIQPWATWLMAKIPPSVVVSLNAMMPVSQLGSTSGHLPAFVLAPGDKVYETGSACTSGSDCTYMPSSTCNDGLCHTDSLSGPPETNDICPGAANMNDEIRMAFVDRHNELKSSGAKGLEPDGAGGNAPKGKQSLKYRWDCAIEANAIAWGNTCSQAHSTSQFRNPSGEQWGENLYTSSGEQNPKQAAVTASNLWWSELKEYGVGQDNIRTDAVKARGVGHYTQMAWETTYKIGCSVNYCSGKTWVVCQYGPAGNYLNQLIYTKGDPCTSDAGCPSDTTCSVSEGLCVKP